MGGDIPPFPLCMKPCCVCVCILCVLTLPLTNDDTADSISDLSFYYKNKKNDDSNNNNNVILTEIMIIQ